MRLLIFLLVISILLQSSFLYAAEVEPEISRECENVENFGTNENVHRGRKLDECQREAFQEITDDNSSSLETVSLSSSDFSFTKEPKVTCCSNTRNFELLKPISWHVDENLRKLYTAIEKDNVEGLELILDQISYSPITKLSLGKPIYQYKIPPELENDPSLERFCSVPRPTTLLCIAAAHGSYNCLLHFIENEGMEALECDTYGLLPLNFAEKFDVLKKDPRISLLLDPRYYFAKTLLIGIAQNDINGVKEILQHLKDRLPKDNPFALAFEEKEWNLPRWTVMEMCIALERDEMMEELKDLQRNWRQEEALLKEAIAPI
jgi:hypothetical protein